MDHVDDTGKLAQIVGLFHGRIAAAYDGQRLVAESRQGAVADRTGAHAAVFVYVFRWQAEVIGPGAGGHNHGVRLVTVLVGGCQPQRPNVEIHADNIFGNHADAEIDGLLTHQFHQFRPAGALSVMRGHEPLPLWGDGALQIRAKVAGWEAGVIFHLGRQGQLAQRQRARQAVLLGNGTLEDQWFQGGPGRVNCGRPSGGTAADDNDFFRHGVEYQQYRESLRSTAIKT